MRISKKEHRYMEKKNLEKKILALLFVAVIAYGMLGGASYKAVGELYCYLSGDLAADEAGEDETENLITSISEVDSQYVDSMTWKQDLINLNGLMAKKLNIRGYYSDMGMYITEDNYIVSLSAQTSTDYEYEQVLSLKEYLDDKGINLVYVNIPTKYTDDDLFSREFGVESYSNRNTDLFLERISAAGVNTIDLRDDLESDGKNIYEMFYHTDHHWTTRSGLWAAGKIARGLNQYCGYSIDLSIYDESNYEMTEWKECWLGEQGRKIGLSYVGLDDFTEIKPKFETSFIFQKEDKETKGSFDDYINEKYYDVSKDVYLAKSWHYSYALKPSVCNELVQEGKILFLGDSNSHVLNPFLSLGVSQIDSVILRGYKGSIREKIEAGDYDTVIIGYVQFMIGAHDKEKSANYRMFNLE